ncbi:MAG: NUDIX hydrolase [Actinomycetales bacterium]|nr:NUDIX hydrolase [Actinomycetales bacterium]
MIQDEPAQFESIKSETVFSGRIWDVREDTFQFGDQQLVRDYIVHPGAVGVIALNDLGQLLLVQQYRRSLGKMMWEPPAGLLDVAGEDPLDAAKRELQEETGYLASDWRVLFDFAPSAGGSNELIRCYLATGLELHEEGRPQATGEEENMEVQWVPVGEVMQAIQAGTISNSLLITGTFALLAAMADPDAIVRPPDAPWLARQQ